MYIFPLFKFIFNNSHRKLETTYKYFSLEKYITTLYHLTNLKLNIENNQGIKLFRREDHLNINCMYIC